MITAEMEHTARRWPQSAAEFEELVDALQHRLVRFACSRLQSRGDAEDVVQDVFVHAWREREKYRKVESVEPFLFRMTANRATDGAHAHAARRKLRIH